MVNINYSISIKDRLIQIREARYGVSEKYRYTPIDTREGYTPREMKSTSSSIDSMDRSMSQEILDASQNALKILNTFHEKIPSLKASILTLLNYDDDTELTEKPIVNHYEFLFRNVSEHYYNKINHKLEEIKRISEIFESSENSSSDFYKIKYENKLLKLREKHLPKLQCISFLYNKLQTNLSDSLNNMQKESQIDLTPLREVMDVLRSDLLERSHSSKSKSVENTVTDD